MAFEPKPVQQPIPIFIGGESQTGRRRASRLGNGWIGMTHTPDTVATQLAILRDEHEKAGRLDLPFEVTVGGECASEDDVLAWEAAGSTA